MASAEGSFPDKVARGNMGSPIKFEFQQNNNKFISTSANRMAHIYTEKIFVAYQKFKFNRNLVFLFTKSDNANCKDGCCP